MSPEYLKIETAQRLSDDVAMTRDVTSNEDEVVLYWEPGDASKEGHDWTARLPNSSVCPARDNTPLCPAGFRFNSFFICSYCYTSVCVCVCMYTFKAGESPPPWVEVQSLLCLCHSWWLSLWQLQLGWKCSSYTEAGRERKQTGMASGNEKQEVEGQKFI